MLNELQTPTRDGGTLLLPPTEAVGELLSSAGEALGSMDFKVAGVPAADLRLQARGELSGATHLPKPWIATAHQSEMHHAGVWFKDAAAAALADATGGTGFHIVADLDVAHHANLAVPRKDGHGCWQQEHIPLADAAVSLCPAQLPAPSAAAVVDLAERVRQSLPVRGVFDTWASHATRHAGDGTSLAEWIHSAKAAVNESLGVNLRDGYWSHLARGRSFCRFVADIGLRFEEMFVAHREALAAHRKVHEIHNPTQPVPDLRQLDDGFEMPLWAYRGAGPRRPVYARGRGNGVELFTIDGPLVLLSPHADAAVESLLALAGSGTVIAPRALTLTMYMRTFLLDVFIHGTGGARYDLLGDELTRRWFGWTPPPFVTATATMRLGLDRFDVTEADHARARWDLHHAWHNPAASAIADGCELDGQAKQLQARLTELLGQVTTAPRRSGERAEAFAESHRVKDALRKLTTGHLNDLGRRVQTIGRRLDQNAVADSREFFFAFLPADRLCVLIAEAQRWARGALASPGREDDR